VTGRTRDRALVWFRRDLRDFDHAALFYALREARAVFCAFIFDREILDALPSADDRRVEFIWDSVRELGAALHALGGELIVRHAFARTRSRLAAALGELRLRDATTSPPPVLAMRPSRRRSPIAASRSGPQRTG
jgi:deoxyribodipyrimidine photolyase